MYCCVCVEIYYYTCDVCIAVCVLRSTIIHVMCVLLCVCVGGGGGGGLGHGVLRGINYERGAEYNTDR